MSAVTRQVFVLRIEGLHQWIILVIIIVIGAA